MKLFKFLLAQYFLVNIITLTGCGVVAQNQSRATNEKLMQLSVGMSRDQVLATMGNPFRREVYEDTEFLIYVTNNWAESEADRFTPICVKEGKVVGWGRSYYDNSLKIKSEITVR